MEEKRKVLLEIEDDDDNRSVNLSSIQTERIDDTNFMSH